MIIKDITIKNVKSFGNNPQTIKLENKGNLILLSGINGSGKCVEKTTCVDIDIKDLQLNNELISFLETTEEGNRIFSYVKESNPSLYEKIKNFKENI